MREPPDREHMTAGYDLQDACRLAFQEDHASGGGDRGDNGQQQQRCLVFAHLDIPTFNRAIMSVRVVMLVVYEKAFVKHVKSVVRDDRRRRRSKRFQTMSTKAKEKSIGDLEVRQNLIK